jgi:hypothetical protein
MNQMANEFGNRLERQHVNDHSRVKIRPEPREFNVRMIVRRVNTNIDEFVVIMQTSVILILKMCREI